MYCGDGRQLTVITAFLLLISHASAFYLPGVAPTTYRHGAKVPLHVNRLTPSRGRDGKIRTALTYDYYERPFHFCRPKPEPTYISESLGSIVFGDRIQSSPFVLHLGINRTCLTVPHCGPQVFEPADAKFVNKRIWQNFQINLLVDGLPAGGHTPDRTNGGTYLSPGFDLGTMKNGKPVFNNHYSILVDFHKVGGKRFRVVGVEVEPSSNNNVDFHEMEQAGCKLPPQEIVLSEKKNTEVVFTYDVLWRESTTPFATRWDKYLQVQDPNIHWLPLINSAIVVIFLSSLVFLILVRALRKDISRYNRLERYALEDLSQANGNSHDAEDVQEDSGWKLIHGDVFRPPNRPMLLSIMVGNGVQLFMMTGFTIAFALFGFLSPSSRGSLGSVMILLYTLFGGVGGFASTYIYKNFATEQRWKQNIILTPLGLPAVVFATFFVLNFFLWFRRSSGAVPFTTMLVLILIWFIISMPLSFLGSWLALKKKPIEFPCRTNQIPRQIPEASHVTGSGLTAFLQRPTPSLLLTGILPYAAIFLEVHYIMTSIWSSQVYYMFGFLFLCFGLMVLTCASITVLNVYFLLCSEDYQWQWRSFFMSGACSFYLFVNALWFWGGQLDLGVFSVSGVLYLGYSLLISLLVFVLTGTIGFLTSLIFVLRIYKSIKVD